MSSGSAEDFVARGKLAVHIAENGHSYELECDESTPVEAVQGYIESVEGIPVNDQLLLCLDAKLEPQRPLGFYKLPSSDREVFLYNRARLSPDSPLPGQEQVENDEICEPRSPSSSHNPHPLDEALDPALKALPSYERQFRYHFHCGKAIYNGTIVKYDNCERFLKEQKVQLRALETAMANMDHYYRILEQMYMDFMKCYGQRQRYHSDLLSNFKRDIEKLKVIKLHPALKTESRKCLLDFVKEEKLWKSVDECNSFHRQFETKVLELKQMFNELKQRVDDLFSIRTSVAIGDFELMIKEHQGYIGEQKSIMQSLSKDVNTVKKLVDDCLSCQLSTSLRPHDAVSALGPMYDVHEKNHLPKMRNCENSISKLLDSCKNKKNEMNLFVHNCMQKVAYVQYIIKDLRKKFPAFKEVMAHQDFVFRDLKLVRGIGPAYRACLAEVVRRKSSMKLYMGMAGQLAERLAMRRDVEVKRREEFNKTQGEYIPRDILASMGLFDTPSQCDVNIAPFDGNLLEIDIADVDRYAPERLVGMPLKLERYGTPKGSFSLTNESSQLSEADDSSVGTIDTEGIIEGCESMEIAGTSKMEVENARLKAELASAIAILCSLNPEMWYESLDDSKLESLLRSTAEKTSEALHLKDEYAKQLQCMLNQRQLQSLSYEKRIQELEQRLADHYLQGQKLSSSKEAYDSAASTMKADDCKSEISGDGEAFMGQVSADPMDEASCTLASLDTKVERFSRQSSKSREGLDENMTDSSSVLNPQLDLLMLEQQHHGLQIVDKGGKGKLEEQTAFKQENIVVDRISDPLNIACDTVAESGSAASISQVKGDFVLELQNALADKSNECSETESKLKAAIEEISTLKKEFEISQKLLDESQMNCAHLENCLHEAREEAHTHLCAADRRASEYSALRASALKMRSLFERLRSTVTASGGIVSFADSLRGLAFSLANSANDNEDDGTMEFRACIRVLADKVGALFQQRAEFLERCSRAEAAQGYLKKELDEKKELVKCLYNKHQLEKQANKEKISFGRLEVHDIAAFVLNSASHYEAINRHCSNYYLSAECVAFYDHLPSKPIYIIGLIVHIERQVVKSPTLVRSMHGRDQEDNHLSSGMGTPRPPPVIGSRANPYGLPLGCEYFVVTVAMLPVDSSPPS
ncbi:hypothetical protein Syun_025171 [Stephania yunnanensis]|uniref:Ubiquitin-like domain-containing protein n=1 Tax=Stephania yunnanensis TaxID=152371 RepID=A0AAP0ERM9_9MAGN